MPGRQSTGPPKVQQSKPKKSKGKRSLNALAIAEKTAPAQKKRRQHRLGESEDTRPSKRKRYDDDGTNVSEEDSGKRRRRAGADDENVELRSDSSGNEWKTGEVDNDADSDLDSDQAIGESDQERFEGFAFRGSSSQMPQRGSKEPATRRRRGVDKGPEFDLGESEDDGDNGEEDDDLAEEGVDLADVLDEELDVLEDQDEDEQGSEAEQESMLSVSDDERDTNNASKLASLQDLVSNMNEADIDSRKGRAPDPQEMMTPSEFGLTSRRQLTVADIASTVTDPQLKKSLKLLADNDTKSPIRRGAIPKKLDAPLAKRQQDRIDRTAAYEKSKETLNRWVDTVKHNRRAEHLSFPLQDPHAQVPQGQKRLLPQSKPVTDLESTVQKIMQDSGLAGPSGKSGDEQIQAFEELKTNKMPIEEVLARRAELRRQRDLLFREEIKAKRIKKIKSKQYRKVHRKERERDVAHIRNALAADGEIDSGSEKERNDRRRAEERMGAKHRESKWAQGIKDSGRAKWDEDARYGVSEMARRNEELRRRMEGKEVRGEDESEASLSEHDDSDTYQEGGGQPEVSDRVRRLLTGEDEHHKSGAANSKLFEMDFMKRAQANTKAQNEDDVEHLRRDLAGEETPSEDDEDEGAGRKVFGLQKEPPVQPKPNPVVSRNEFDEPDPSDEEQDARSRRAGVDIDRVVIDPGRRQNVTNLTTNGSKLPRVEVSGGPWIGNGSGKGEAMKQLPRSALKGARAAEKVQQNGHVVDNRATSGPQQDGIGQDEDGSDSEEPIIMTNADLARRAFAGDDVLDQKFMEEKEELTKDQDDRIVDNTLPGWGTWVGLGVGKKASKPKARHREVKKITGIAPENRKDAKLKDVIISEKKVKKNAKYLAHQLPHPFETRAQYERSLRLPVGPEWTTKETFQGMTKPRVLMKQGVIAPMAKPMV